MNMDDVQVQLYALRHHLDAIILSVERSVFTSAPAPETGCPHPAEHRRDVSTMGSQKWRCLKCDEEFEGVA